MKRKRIKPLSKRELALCDARAIRAERKFLRDINKRLRRIEHRAGVAYVAAHLDKKFSEAARLLSGEKRLTLDDMSDLAHAVGCKAIPTITKAMK